MARPSASLGAPEPFHHDLSQDPLLDIPDAQASCSRSPSPLTRVKHSRSPGHQRQNHASPFSGRRRCSSLLKVPSLPRFHGGGVEKLGLAVDSTIAALVKASPVGGLARDPACPNPHFKPAEGAVVRGPSTDNGTQDHRNTNTGNSEKLAHSQVLKIIMKTKGEMKRENKTQ
ncbi:UNVERIFIED_CONTAM: hypothetical protein FKN15_016153 [Acipenser sinensis]